jgi:hypothetical protein
MEAEKGPEWLAKNWNYIVAIIVFFAMIYYRPKLNEIVYISIFSPLLVYFLILQPLIRDNE